MAASDIDSACRETVEIKGHIIDSLLLPKILDCVTSAGGQFRILDISIGQARSDASYALVEVLAESPEALKKTLAVISDHGATPVADVDCYLEQTTIAGTFPEGFYSTTNQRTEVRVGDKWLPVDRQEMDCGIAIDLPNQVARCVPMTSAQQGDQFVVGHAGVRVFPANRDTKRHSFEFMNSSVSTEKPKGVAIRQVARQLHDTRKQGEQAVLVGGPAIVHTGSVEHVSYLIQHGYLSSLFAGNALATHDIEQSMFGTSLGVRLDCGTIVDSGHEHHLRAINRVRRAGGIEKAVQSGILTSGIMFECVKHNVDFLLAGSIRDDGPLPDVITDALHAQDAMRERLRDVSFCLMVATTLHSIAVGNLLPAYVHVVCVDINPSTVIKLSDRGSFQTVGLVTDVEPFFRSLINELKLLEANG